MANVKHIVGVTQYLQPFLLFRDIRRLDSFSCLNNRVDVVLLASFSSEIAKFHNSSKSRVCAALAKHSIW